MTREISFPCPACGGTESRREITAPDFMLELDGVFHVSRCLGCGLFFQNPRPPAESLKLHYPAAYDPYTPREMKAGRPLRWELKNRRGYSHLDPGFIVPWRRVRGRYEAEANLIPEYVPGGRLLEIACASGARLSLLRELGWRDCIGIEPGEAAAARARELGFEVLNGKVEDVLEEIPDASLDVVIAAFVMEHLENPFAVVRALAPKLKPGGQFLFSTLNIPSPDFRWYGKYWYNLDLPRHHVFFRRRDLLGMLEGFFRVEKVTCLAAPNDYAGSARYRARHAPRFSDRLLTRANPRLLFPVCLLLAWMGLSSRVALRCGKPSIPGAGPPSATA